MASLAPLARRARMAWPGRLGPRVNAVPLVRQVRRERMAAMARMAPLAWLELPGKMASQGPLVRPVRMALLARPARMARLVPRVNAVPLVL